MKDKKTKNCTIFLPYFKQGDDLGYHLQNSSSLSEALENHAKQMDTVAQVLRQVESVIRNEPSVEIQADTHMIFLTGPTELVDVLVKEELASYDEFEDDEEDETEDDEEVSNS